MQNRRDTFDGKVLPDKSITADDVIAAVAEEFAAEGPGLTESGRRANRARQVSIHLLRTLTEMSNDEIAELFGIAENGVYKAGSRLRREMAKNPRLRETVTTVEHTLLSHPGA